MIETVYGFSITVGGFDDGAAAGGEGIVCVGGGGVSCVKFVETVVVGVGGSGSERVVAELLEAILSFLKRGILADVYIGSVGKNICYLFCRDREKKRGIFADAMCDPCWRQ